MKAPLVPLRVGWTESLQTRAIGGPGKPLEEPVGPLGARKKFLCVGGAEGRLKGPAANAVSHRGNAWSVIQFGVLTDIPILL
jgi:hypothetical protein